MPSWAPRTTLEARFAFENLFFPNRFTSRWVLVTPRGSRGEERLPSSSGFPAPAPTLVTVTEMQGWSRISSSPLQRAAPRFFSTRSNLRCPVGLAQKVPEPSFSAQMPRSPLVPLRPSTPGVLGHSRLSLFTSILQENLKPSKVPTVCFSSHKFFLYFEFFQLQYLIPDH